MGTRLPVSTASAPRARTAARSGVTDSGIGSGPVSIRVNRPLRSRSARTTSVTLCGRRPSFSKIGMMTGKRAAPVPVISMDS